METSPTILLVEDEPLLREVTGEELQDLGYAIVAAGDASEALAQLEGERALAAMITDIRMPGPCNGWELARRARELRPGLPIVYLSGYSDIAANPVSDAVLVNKPYRPHELVDALARVGAR